MTYTREQLEAMSDRDLDAVVAEKVMGWKWHLCHQLNMNGEMVYHFSKHGAPSWWDSPGPVPRPELPEVNGVRRFCIMGLPFYSTSIADAFEVVEHLAGKNIRLRVCDQRDRIGKWDVRFWFSGYDIEWMPFESLSRGVCIAAVLAVSA